jgi:hypothetical protein
VIVTGIRLLESKLRDYPRPYLTDAELDSLLGGTPDSRYGKVKRLLAQGKLLHIRRGLYCLTDVVGCKVKPHPYELAQYVYGPSYISLESALSFHRLIPERVYTITNATGKRAKEFHSSLGLFSYLHLPLKNLFTGVELVNEGGHQFFVAMPWKAICDYVFCYKKDWKGLEPLLENLRIELDNLPMLRNEEIQLLDEYYQSARVSRFLKGVRHDLHHAISNVLVHGA